MWVTGVQTCALPIFGRKSQDPVWPHNPRPRDRNSYTVLFEEVVANSRHAIAVWHRSTTENPNNNEGNSSKLPSDQLKRDETSPHSSRSRRTKRWDTTPRLLCLATVARTLRSVISSGFAQGRTGCFRFRRAAMLLLPVLFISKPKFDQQTI